MTTLVLFGPKLYFLVQKTSRDFVADVVLELDRDGGIRLPPVYYTQMLETARRAKISRVFFAKNYERTGRGA
jgi:hypothetical protein